MENNYQNKKAQLRQEAIEWQISFSASNQSYAEMLKAQERFQKLGKRYGLTKEFKENGII